MITTPESLNLLLTSPNNRRLLEGVETVILDEIHAVLDSKRGTHLITAVDRLVPLAGDFQRIALSATVRPLLTVADFVGGFVVHRDGSEWIYRKRAVGVCRASETKQYRLAVDTAAPDPTAWEDPAAPEAPGTAASPEAPWQALAAAALSVICLNRSTLIFCNNRRGVEKLTRQINDTAGETLVYAHHGSLSRELRLAVEQKLKKGELLLPEPAAADPVEQEELIRERVRRLLDRYGILFRELLLQELPGLQWRDIFRRLRLMEFSGEVIAGPFFEGVSGLQFASAEAYRLLSGGLNEDRIYWLNAADPASPCGLKLPGLDPDLPARLPTSYVVFKGSRLLLAARRNGKELLIKIPPGDPDLPACFAFCQTLLTRAFNPLKSVIVESINGQPSPQSPYRKALQELGFDCQYRFLELRKSYHGAGL